MPVEVEKMALLSHPSASARRSTDDGAGLASTEQLLVAGGDGRIALNPASALNQYGCQPFPDPERIAFGSSTASDISVAGFFAADQLRRKLALAAATEPREITYTRELNRIRQALLRLCAVSDLPGLETVFAASGTDLHLIAAQLVGSASRPTLVVMVDTAETGSGILAALTGRHCSLRAALGEGLSADTTDTRLAGSNTLEVVTVPIRFADGTPRPAARVDAQVESLVSTATAKGWRVLLVLVDHSKTGVIAPSPACVAALRQRMQGKIEVLVDACQFRIAPSTVRAYLAQDFMLALTGSKFVTGPSFSGALLIPAGAALRLSHPLPGAIRKNALRADWPQSWSAARHLGQATNYGLLLRWEAALEELRAFRAVPDASITSFLQTFAGAVEKRLLSDPAFALLPVPQLDRRPLVEARGWDHIQTVFSFVLKRPGALAAKAYLTRDETMRVYQMMQLDQSGHLNLDRASLNREIARLRFQLGQPVICGHRDGVPVSALRLCASARMIVEATAQGGRNAAAIIAHALAALDKAAWLAQSGWIGGEAHSS